MDIKQLQNQPRVTTVNSPKTGSATTAESTQSAIVANSKDSVVVSSQAQQLQSLQGKISSLPDVDVKKVAEIKAAIAEGRYKVDPEKLAGNIAQFEADMNDINLEA
ncbi:flagellar biosynthesis anti-sigma factor FlgM [Shewanella avicenniae]|uniref:Negative regulator of flagellin synthesis n=1 Tax=Shewanella avicenniae TaxID=2814294 RepID=A0ABX7QPF6_9GAMM|nr:flagellar biosynthesis anti-sigma factor FlgM [Shewanella avicenniae]QSX32745.1 flagellar biosynthesis anti-sigma factor FlgM [Shewanella avicenniae]